MQMIRFCSTAAVTKHNDARRRESGHTDSHGEVQGQGWFCLDGQSAGMTTSISQDTGITVTASKVTICLDVLLSCQKKKKKKNSKESWGKCL